MNIKQIRAFLAANIDRKIIVIYYGSRNRKVKMIGYLERVYNNIFLIKLYNGTTKCFNLTDILTKTVQIYI